MRLIELTEKEQKKHEKIKKREELKKKLTLFKAKFFGNEISTDDTRTIQAHRNYSSGKYTDYYILNPYLQDGTSYTDVVSILEDYPNEEFIYAGIVRGAGNAIGLLESNIPLDKIVASPNGNILLQQVISRENASSVRDMYYRAIGESTEPIENHTTFFGKPDFPLGKIIKTTDGVYKYKTTCSQRVEQILQQDLEEMIKESEMRDKNSVEIDLGPALVVAKEDCWLEQENGIQFAGINNKALYYKYSPSKPIKTSDGKYVYMGTATIGEAKGKKMASDRPVEIVTPFVYSDVVLWTEGKSLIQYFLENKFNGLNFTLGEIFTNSNLKEETADRIQKIAGGISINSQGECERIQSIPETVEQAIKELIQNKKQKESNIINLNEKR